MSLKSMLKCFCLLFLLASLTGCSAEEDTGSSYFSSEDPDTNPGPGSGTNPGTTPVGDIEPSSFWVTLKNDEFPTYINAGLGDYFWGSECRIDVTESSSMPKDCYIDVLEGDLYMHALNLQYNVPPDLCQHVRSRPAWHWNTSSGTGPSKISMAFDADDKMTCQAEHSFSGNMIDCSNHLELEVAENAVSCRYKNGNDQACCFGDYELEVTRTDEDGVSSTETSTENWGGDVRNCIGGPGSAGWSIFDDDGYPKALIQTIPESSGGANIGLNAQISMPSNVSTTQSTFSTMANFYITPPPSSTEKIHGHRGYYQGESPLPYAVEPIDDLDGSLVQKGNEAFEFDCLDGGFEVKHRIRVFIREWNTSEEFHKYATTLATEGNPDVEGLEGDPAGCQYNDEFGNLCNDFFDFDDILNSLTGDTYDTSTPDFEARTSFFPEGL